MAGCIPLYPRLPHGRPSVSVLLILGTVSVGQSATCLAYSPFAVAQACNNGRCTYTAPSQLKM